MSMTEEMIPGLATMADEIRGFVTQGLSETETGEGVASVVSDYVNKEILLKPEHRVGDPERHKQHILHVEPDGSFSIVSLVWLPGQR